MDIFLAQTLLQNLHFFLCTPRINLPNFFQDKSVTSSITDYFQNSGPPIICYKYNKPIRHTIFNFNKLVSDLDFNTNTPSSRDCKDSKFIYPSVGHV